LQFVRLPRLHRLRLESCSYSTGSMSRLSALSGSLTRLEIEDVVNPVAEAGLAALTRLQHLMCALVLEEAGQAVAAAVHHLTGLTCLSGRGRMNPLPPALSCLTRLQL
jgi:hypothetical protein